MTPLNPYAMSGFLIATTFFVLFWYLWSNANDNIQKVFAFYIFCNFGWGLMCFFIAITQASYISIWLWKLATIFVTFIPLTLFHTVSLIKPSLLKKYIPVLYLQGLFIVLMTISGVMMNDVYSFKNQFYYFKATFFYNIAIAWWIGHILVIHFYLFRLYFNGRENTTKKQIWWLFSCLIGLLGGATNFIPGYHIELYPIGNFLVPLNIICICVAIFHFKLFNYKIQNHNLIYAIIFGFFMTLSVVLIGSFERMLQSWLGYPSGTTGIFGSILLILLLLPIFQILKSKIDIYLFRKSPNELLDENKKYQHELIKSEKHKIISSISASIAHEIKNPLTSLLTFSEYLPEKLSDKDYLTKFCSILQNETKRINSLVEQLLNYSKPSPPEKKDSDLDQLIDETILLVEGKIKQKNITLTRINTEKDLKLYVDPDQIKQALLNIILNAIDAVDENTGHITVTTKQDTINHNNYISIKISDNGPGIPKDKLKSILEPFVSNKPNGTGLGLAITKNIIEGHGGKLQIKKFNSKFSSFIISLEYTKRLHDE